MNSIVDGANQMVGLLRDSLRRIRSQILLYSCFFAVLLAVLFVWSNFGFRLLHLTAIVVVYALGLLAFVLGARDVTDPWGDGEARDLFREATSTCRWLGIAGTPKFRNDIRSPEPSERHLLLLMLQRADPAVSYQFLFVNPYCRSFEERMKEEGKGRHDLQRVRNEVIELSRTLAGAIARTQ